MRISSTTIGKGNNITPSTALTITNTSTTIIQIYSTPIVSTTLESEDLIASVNMSTPNKSTINMESLNIPVSTQATNRSNSIVLISVIIIMAITMVSGCVVCSFIIVIINWKKSHADLASKIITVNAGNIADNADINRSTEIQILKNDAYGCIHHGESRVVNTDLHDIEMKDQEYAEDQAYEYIPLRTIYFIHSNVMQKFLVS